MKLENQDVIELPDIRLDLTTDTPVLVRNYENKDWDRRYFKCWDDEGCVCFVNGGTSWSRSRAISWKYWKMPEDNNE